MTRAKLLGFKTEWLVRKTFQKLGRQKVELLNYRGREGRGLGAGWNWIQDSNGGVGINRLTWPLSPLRGYVPRVF